MADITDFGQVNWSLKDDHAEERKRRMDNVWKHIKPLDGISFDGQKDPTSKSTTSMIDDLAKMGITFGSFVNDPHTDSTCEMDKVSVGLIPESEEQNAQNWFDVYRRLNIISRRLDPRISHDDKARPYDPIDLAFRIYQAVQSIDELKKEISSRFNFVEPAIDHWTDLNT